MRLSLRLTRSAVGVAVALVAAAGVGAGVGAGGAVAAPTPIVDPDANGYLGFCDSTHHQVRGGTLAAAPFAWTTVASVPAPTGYEKGRASLYVFQPRKNVNPSDWSSRAMTAASTFTNPKHPMAAGTGLDPALADFTGSFPPELQGLLQVRMAFSAPNRPQYVGAHPAVYVRVEGDRWTQVDGGPVACDAGSARSVEQDALSAGRLKIRYPRPKPETAAQVKQHATGGATTGGNGTSHPSGQQTASSGAGAPGAAPTASAAANRSAVGRTSGDGMPAWVWVLIAAVVVLGAGAIAVRRRRTRNA